MNDRTDRDLRKWKSISNFRCYINTGKKLLSNFQALGSEDICLCSICIIQKGDTCRTSWIVLYRLNRSRNTSLVTFKVDLSALLLMSTTNVTHGHTTLA